LDITYINKIYALDVQQNLPRLQSMGEFEGRVLNKAHNKKETFFSFMVWQLKIAYV